MPTARQIEANRRNAQKSTGPRTAQGKRASSLNAYKHGITGQTLLMSPEQAEAYEHFTDSLVRDLRPVGALEEQLARSIADTHWRINRAAAIENNIFESEAWNQETWAAHQSAEWNQVSCAQAIVRSFVEDPRRFQLLTTYEMRLVRKAQTALKQLRELQAARAAEPAPVAAEPPVAEKTLTATAAAPQPDESAVISPANGFVFSGRPTDEQVEAYLTAAPVGPAFHPAAELPPGADL